jgi:hypothetical protein
MTFHFTNVNELKNKADSGVDSEKTDRVFLMKTLVHSADIGNPSRPFEYAKQWTFRILDEFFAQVISFHNSIG